MKRDFMCGFVPDCIIIRHELACSCGHTGRGSNSRVGGQASILRGPYQTTDTLVSPSIFIPTTMEILQTKHQSFFMSSTRTQKESAQTAILQL